MIAYCWKGGQIEFGRKAPKGTIVIARAPAKQLRRAVEPLARLSYDGKTMLVPGVPEAAHWRIAIDAVIAFEKGVRVRLERITIRESEVA